MFAVSFAVLSAAKFFYSTLAVIAAAAELAVAAHTTVLANAAPPAGDASASDFSVNAVAAPATQLALASQFFVSANAAAFAIDTVAADLSVLANAFPVTNLAHPLQLPVRAHSDSAAFLALGLDSTVLTNAAATTLGAFVALLAVDTQPTAATFFAQVLLLEMFANCSRPALFASRSVTIVRAKFSAIRGPRRRNETAESVRFTASILPAPPATAFNPASAPLWPLVVAAQKAHELAFGHYSRQRRFSQSLCPGVLVISIPARALQFGAGLSAQTTQYAGCAKEVAAREQVECIGAAVADLAHKALVVVICLGAIGGVNASCSVIGTSR